MTLHEALEWALKYLPFFDDPVNIQKQADAWKLLAAPLPLQRTLPDEQFKGAVVEAVDNEISITIRGQEQVAIVMEALHKAGFVGGQCASPAGRAEQEPK